MVLGKLTIDAIVKNIEANYGCKIRSYKHKSVDFMDVSLDLPEPGKMYAQVITPGYKVLAKVNSSDKLYHANLAGTLIKENPDTSDF